MRTEHVRASEVVIGDELWLDGSGFFVRGRIESTPNNGDGVFFVFELEWSEQGVRPPAAFRSPRCGKYAMDFVIRTVASENVRHVLSRLIADYGYEQVATWLHEEKDRIVQRDGRLDVQV